MPTKMATEVGSTFLLSPRRWGFLAVLSLGVASIMLERRTLQWIADENNFLQTNAITISIPTPTTRATATATNPPNAVSWKHPWMDPEHTPRLQRFTEMDQFPAPDFHGCVEGNGLCKYSNVCFSRRDGMLVLDTPSLAAPTAPDAPRWFEPFHGYYETMKVSPPRLPKLVPRETYSKFSKVYFADKLMVMNCWQQEYGDKNPVHMLMGLGKLFVHATGLWDDGAPHEQFDLLLFHQCTPIMKDWSWGNFVADIIWKEAVSKKSIAGPRSDVSLYMPYEPEEKEDSKDPPGDDQERPPDFPEADDVVVCGKTVYQEPYSSGMYFDTNDWLVAERWHKIVDDLVVTNPTVRQYIKANETSSTVEFADDPKACAKNLKISAFQRTEGSALRRFMNMDDVKGLVKDYTNKDLEVFSITSATPPEEQAALFRSFDLLLTPHGSHNVNMIFNSRRSSFVEISAVYYDDGNLENGRKFVKNWFQSVGHRPYNNKDLNARFTECLVLEKDRSLDGPCPLFSYRLKMIQSDIVIDIETLRWQLENAIESLCPGFRD